MTTWYRECDEQLGTVFEDEEPEEEDAADAKTNGTTNDAATKARADADDAATDDDAAGEGAVGILSRTNRKYDKLSLGKEEESAFIPQDKGEERGDRYPSRFPEDPHPAVTHERGTTRETAKTRQGRRHMSELEKERHGQARSQGNPHTVSREETQ